MTDGMSARLGLPLLAAGQAQKEVTHNEALALIDLALHPAVLAVDVNAPPEAPAIGQAWATGAAPTGAWTGRPHALAGWTDGGWRFVPAAEGMLVWSMAAAAPARFVAGAWRPFVAAAAVADPAGGPTVDAEARTALVQILAVLRAHRLVAG